MNYVISYPRSGNTAARYLIEQLTGRPTNGICGPVNPKDKLQKPLIHTGEDFVFHKRHDFKGVEDEDFVLFIIRDPLEACIRHNEHQRGLSLDKMKGYLAGWFDLLYDYDEHMLFTGGGMVWYYDQLIKVADRASLDIYPNPQSTGPHFHKAKLGSVTVTLLEEWMQQKYEYLYKKYL